MLRALFLSCGAIEKELRMLHNKGAPMKRNRLRTRLIYNRSFVREAKNRSELDIPLNVLPGTPLLTLVTCSGDGEDGRLMIVCAQKSSMDA